MNILAKSVSAVGSGSSGFGSPVAATIASGVLTITGTGKHFITVDTEGSASTDDLTSISGGAVGDELILQCANNARNVVCKTGASLLLQEDFTLDNVADSIELLCSSAGVWKERNRANNA
jgi:hypothetical protein